MRKYNGLTQIISGGQTGADIAGLEFAKEIRIPTAGYAPKGFRTEAGISMNLKTVYGLIEYGTGYAPRTKKNILTSDGTVIFAETSSAGSILTAKYCRREKKPYIIAPNAEKLKKWLYDNRIVVLNVAGNRASVSPGIGERVKKVLRASITNQ